MPSPQSRNPGRAASGADADPNGSQAPSTARELWIHPGTYTYRPDKPEALIETVWIEHPGWGYIKRRDMWLRVVRSEEELRASGFIELNTLSEKAVTRCPFCGMHISAIPGSLVAKHTSECGGNLEDWLKMEDAVLSAKRMKDYEAKIMAALLRKKEEEAAQERRDRFDRIKEEAMAKQKGRNRKQRMKDETKAGWKKYRS